MEVSKHIYSNAISEDCPTYFKSNHYVDIKKNFSHSIGKRVFAIPAIKDILSPKPEKKISYFRAKVPIDQDLDSLKLSIQPDITRGYKNTLRYQSNHHKSFFENVENSGYKRLSTEITSLHKMPKILRTLKVDSTSRQKQKSIKLYKVKYSPSTRPSELSYLLEISLSNSKKKTLSKIERQPSTNSEIDDFERKLREQSFDRSQNLYEFYETKRKGTNLSSFH